MNYIASSAANGSIGYVEYSYPLSVGYPVAKVLNSGGYYTLPTQYNVAIALEQAQINMDPSSPDYLLQTLTNVYTDPDPRTYPLSSYVYMIQPTGGPNAAPNDSSETSGKRQSIADFEYYSICQGQSQIGAIGYSPLPVNLVEAAFGQIQKLQTADPSVDLTNLNIDTCHEPTFVPGQPNTNYLTTIAPQPPACDQQGAGPVRRGLRRTAWGPPRARRGAIRGQCRRLGKRSGRRARRLGPPPRLRLRGRQPRRPRRPGRREGSLCGGGPRGDGRQTAARLGPPAGSRTHLGGLGRPSGRRRVPGGLRRARVSRLSPLSSASGGGAVRRLMMLLGLCLSACLVAAAALIGLSGPSAATAATTSAPAFTQTETIARVSWPVARKRSPTPGRCP